MTEQDIKGLIKIGAGTLVLAVIAGGALWVNGIQPQFDEHMCRTDEPVKGHIMIVSDLSEIEDGPGFIGLVREWRDKLPMFHLLSAFGIGDLTKPGNHDEKPEWPLVGVFEACNPGRGDQVNILIRGSLPAQEDYTEFFAEPLDNAVQDAAETAGADTSPILESLVRAVRLLQRSGAEVKTLVVRSDFLEFTNKVSHYREIDDLALTLEHLGIEQPDFSGIHVQAVYVKRHRYANAQTDAHKAFWADFFEAGHARDVIEYVEEEYDNTASNTPPPLLASAPESLQGNEHLMHTNDGGQQ